MVTRPLFAFFAALALSTLAGPVRAEATAAGESSPANATESTPAATPGPSVSPDGPRLLHAPVTVGKAHKPILIYADIVDPELVKEAFVVYEPAGSEGSRAAGGEVRGAAAWSPPRWVLLRRAATGHGYVAEIPAQDVRAPGVAYAIELELTDGTRVRAFASRDAMHRVAVAEDYMDLRERALLRRVSGRRSVISAEAEYASFGESFRTWFPPGGGLESARVADQYYRVETAYTYRLLKAVTEFSARLGVLRGQAPVPLGSLYRPGGAFDVGLDYVAPSVRVRLTDECHADLELLTGLTEERFRLGALSRLLIGDPYGSKLVLGVQGIDGFGVRFWSRVDITANESLLVSPIIEATNFPHADAFGVRLLLELTMDLGSGFGAVAGGGYQARQATSGGPSGELSLRYAF